MTLTQQLFILIYGLINLVVFFMGLHHSKTKQQSFVLTPLLCVFGIFVWGDAVILGLFWSMAAGIGLLLQDWYLFLLIISLFWAIRGLGETVYWINQQFSTINRNNPPQLLGHAIFHADAVWFAYQLFWQMVCVGTIITSIYLSHVWLRSLSV